MKQTLASALELLALPRFRSDAPNRKRRGIVSLGNVTASQLVSAAGFGTGQPTLLWGPHNKTISVLLALVRRLQPCVLVGDVRELQESCLAQFPALWESNSLSAKLRDGCGTLSVEGNAETMLDVKEVLTQWGDHCIVLSLGRGLLLDRELFTLLNQHGNYILLIDALHRSMKCSDQFNAEVLLSGVDNLFANGIGTDARELVRVLPTYEAETCTNTTDFSLHGHGGRLGGPGPGFRLSQARALQTKPVLQMDELKQMQEHNIALAMNARTACLWTAQIVR